LETFGFFCRTFGSVLFSVLGGWLIGSYEHPHPRLYFALSAGNGVLIFLSALIYPKASEEAQSHLSESGHHAEHPHQELSFKEKLQLMWKILGLYRVRKTIKYIIIATLTYVNFEVILSYSNEEQYEITPVVEGSMISVVAFFASIWLIFYNSVFANKRTRWFVIIAVVARFAGTYVLAFQMDVGRTHEYSQHLFFLNSFVFQPLVQAYLITPGAIIFAKCIPHSIESMMTGFITSVVKINSEILMRLASLYFVRNIEFTGPSMYVGLKE
jgi:hypothetical protein